MSDALDAWLSVRSRASWSSSFELRGPIHGVRDGHRHFLDTIVRVRDHERAARLHEALDRVRDDARRGSALTFGRLSEWHRTATGAPASGLRRAVAFAKKGDERYGIHGRLEERFAECLSEANRPGESVIARAARAYLDVLFFHPFADGNARAATLALDFVLAREGVVLDQVGPLFVVSRRADHAAGVAAFIRLLELLVSSTHARCTSVANGEP